MNFFRRIVLLMVRVYQKCISPYLPQSCRFHPTCSVYAYEAIDRYGLLKGGLLATKRILRCHPYSDGGFDPVP